MHRRLFLFLAIGLLVCTTVLTLPLLLLEFFRGVESTMDSVIAVPAIAFMAAVAALLHLAYIFPHPRIAPEKRYLLAWLYLPAAIDLTTPYLAIATDTPLAFYADWVHLRAEWIGVAFSLVLLAVAVVVRRARPFRGKRVLIAALVVTAAGHLSRAALSFTLADAGAPDFVTTLVVTLVNAVYMLTCLIAAAVLLISNYRRATVSERRQIKGVMLGLMATILACTLLIATGRASLQVLSVNAHIVLLAMLLCLFPWTLNLAITRHHLLGIERLFSPVSSVIVFSCVWALGEILKDGTRLFIEHLAGEQHVEIIELLVRLVICLAFARINVEKLFGMERGKEDAPREEEQISRASSEAAALERAAHHIARELGARGYAAYARTAAFGPLTLVTKNDGFPAEGATATFRRHVRGGRSGDADQRKLKHLGSEVTFDLTEHNERLALLLFTGVTNSNAESPSVATVLAALKWRLRYTPATEVEAVTA